MRNNAGANSSNSAGQAVGANLLDLPWVFSQRHLLSERKFLDEARRRGVTLSEAGLEALHEHGTLVPLLRIDRDMAAVRRELRRREASPRRWELLVGTPPTTAPELLEATAEGRVADGAHSPFEPWRTRLRRHGPVKYKAWDYLYSPYQLLRLPSARETLADVSRRPRRSVANGLLQARRSAAERERRLLPLLSELEFVYYASVRRRTTISALYGSEDDFDQARGAFDPVVAFNRNGLTSDTLQKVAEDWLYAAHGMDPLRNWIDLVALIDPRWWERLEGDALLAMDFRIAAEMLLRFLEDLADWGVATPLPDHSNSRSWHPLGDRIGRRRARLDRTLTDFGISPHPAVVMLLEGSSELYVMRQLLDYFRIPRLDSFIRLELLGGVTKQIELLARYIAPALGRTEANLAELDRPPTRLMVVTDQEGQYASAAGRQTAKDQLVKHLYNALEPEHQTPTALQELENLVVVETWGSTVRNLEFAHFTDYAIAKAINATGKSPATETVASLESQVAAVRARGGNLKSIWRGPAWAEPKPDKVELWHHLWPVLRARIKRAEKTGTEERIPLVRVTWAAYRLAAGPRSHIVLRV